MTYESKQETRFRPMESTQLGCLHKFVHDNEQLDSATTIKAGLASLKKRQLYEERSLEPVTAQVKARLMAY